ncbi:MAG: NfeD family protein [Candidatus Rokubacteria bacterium]|nr:NfeD family protein [Candidatus Rokubacteria bacterium]
MWCHLVLLVPVVSLGLFFVLPWPAALGVNALLTAGALGIAIPGMRALRQPVVTGREALIGRAAEAATDIHDEGLVRLQGELWTATADGLRIVKGTPVRIVAVRGAILIVELMERT